MWYRHSRVDAEDYDFGLLRQYIALFPRSPLAKLLHAYFEYIGIVLTEEDEEEAPTPKGDEEVDYIEIMMVGCVFIQDLI